MKRKFTILTLVLFFAICISSIVPISYASDVTVFDKLESQLFVEVKENQTVYLGGYPIGLTIDGVGVLVVGLNEFIADDGKICCPSMEAGLKIGDKILQINDVPIYNSLKICQIASQSQGQPMSVAYMRKNQVLTTTLSAKKELCTSTFKIGLYTKDNSSGIGTLTYVKKDLSFGSLGHPVCSRDGKIVNANGGVYLCQINDVVKGQRGTAGELKGQFSYENRLGNVAKNNIFGVFGQFEKVDDFNLQEIEVAKIAEIKPGKAYAFCTLDNNTRQCYEIEIVKAVQQDSPQDKGLVVHITDERLLSKTGGIVQGMSGSPIVQNGKLVGAITHVFINDPTRGYGIYAEWMIKN